MANHTPGTAGEYEPSAPFDLGAVYHDILLSAELGAVGGFVQNLRGIASLRAAPSLRGTGGMFLRLANHLRNVTSLRGIRAEDWSVSLEIATTNDDPENPTAQWTMFTPLQAGLFSFRALKYQLLLTGDGRHITPVIRKCALTVDMPDRIIRGDDIAIAETGLSIAYSPAFRANPALAITLQDAQAGDAIEYSSKNKTGFTARVYNHTIGQYVARSMDYIASGYGRENSL